MKCCITKRSDSIFFKRWQKLRQKSAGWIQAAGGRDANRFWVFLSNREKTVKPLWIEAKIQRRCGQG